MGNAEFRELTYASPVSAEELLRVYRSYILVDSLERLIDVDDANKNNKKSASAGVDDDTGQGAVDGGGGSDDKIPDNNEGWGPMSRTVFTSMFDGQRVPYALVDHLYDSYVVTLRELNGSNGLTRPEFFRVTLKEKLQQVALRKVLEDQQVSATSVQNNNSSSSSSTAAFMNFSPTAAGGGNRHHHASGSSFQSAFSSTTTPKGAPGHRQQQPTSTSAAPHVTTVTIDYNNEDVANMGDMYPDARPDFADMLPLLVTIIPKASSIAALGGHFSSEAVHQQHRRGRGAAGGGGGEGGTLNESTGTFERELMSPTTYISSVAHTGVYTMAGSDDEETRDRGVGSEVGDSRSLGILGGAATTTSLAGEDIVSNNSNVLFAPTVITNHPNIRGGSDDAMMSSLGEGGGHPSSTSTSLSQSPSNQRGVLMMKTSSGITQVSPTNTGASGDLPRFSSRLAGRSGSSGMFNRNSRARSANNSSGTNFNNTARRVAATYPDPIDDDEKSAIELTKKYDSMIYTLSDQGVVDPGEEAVGLAVEKRLLMVYDVWLRRFQSKYRCRKGEYEAKVMPHRYDDEDEDDDEHQPQYTQLPLSLQQLIRAHATVADMRASPPAIRAAKKKKAAVATAAHITKQQQQQLQLVESRKMSQQKHHHPTARSATRFSVTRGLVPLLPRATDKNVAIGGADDGGSGSGGGSNSTDQFDSQFPRHLHPPPLMTLEELKNALFATIKLSVARVRGASTTIKYSSTISSSVEPLNQNGGGTTTTNEDADDFEDLPFANQRQQQQDDHQPTKRQFLERRCTGCGAIPTSVSYECLDCFANIKHQHQDELTNYLAAMKEYHIKQSLYLKAQDRYIAHTAAARSRSARSPRAILPSPTAIRPIGAVVTGGVAGGTGAGAHHQPMPPLPMNTSLTSLIGASATYPTIPHQHEGDDDEDDDADANINTNGEGVGEGRSSSSESGGQDYAIKAAATVSTTMVLSEGQGSDSYGGSRSRSASPMIPSTHHHHQSHQSLRKRVSFQQRPSPLLESSEYRVGPGASLLSGGDEVVAGGGGGITERTDSTSASPPHRILPPSAAIPTAAHHPQNNNQRATSPAGYHSHSASYSASYSTLNSQRLYPQQNHHPQQLQLQAPIAPVMPEVPAILQGGGSTAPPLHILGVPITALLCNRCVGTWEGFTSSIHRKKHLKTHQLRRARWAPKPLQVTHDGVECTSCAMRPIVGTRWRCLDCTDQVNLCDACYRDGEVPLGHTVRHNLWNISTPLTIDEEASSLVEDLTRSIYPLLGVPTPGVCHTVTRRIKDHLGSNAELVGDIVCGQQQQSVLIAPGSRVGTASKIKIVNSIANYSNQLLSVVQKSAVERTRDEVRQAEVLRARAGRIANDWPASLSTLLDDPRQLRHFNTPAIRNYRSFLEYQRSTLSSGDVALIAIAAAQVALSDESESLSSYISPDERNASRIRVSNTKRLAGGNSGGSVAELMRFAVDRYFKDISQLPAFLNNNYTINNTMTSASNYQFAGSMSRMMMMRGGSIINGGGGSSGGFGCSSSALLSNNSNLYCSSLIGLLTATNNNNRSSIFGGGNNNIVPASSMHRSILLRGRQISTTSSSTGINVVVPSSSSSSSPQRGGGVGGAPSFRTIVPGGGGSGYNGGGHRYVEAGGPLGGSGVVERRRSTSQNQSLDTTASSGGHVASAISTDDSTMTLSQKGEVDSSSHENDDVVVIDAETQELDDMEAKLADLLKKGEARRRAALHQRPTHASGGVKKTQVLSPTTTSAQQPPTAVPALQAGLLLPAVHGYTTSAGGGENDMSSPFCNNTTTSSPFFPTDKRGSGPCDTSLITMVNASTAAQAGGDDEEDEDSHTIPLHEVAANVVAAHYAERNSDAELIVTPEVFVAWGSQSEVLSALLRGFEVRYVRLCESVEGVDGTVYNSAAKEAGAISPTS